MFRPIILIVLFWRVCGHVGAPAIFDRRKAAEVLLQDAAVVKMAVRVMFDAPRVGPNYR